MTEIHVIKTGLNYLHLYDYVVEQHKNADYSNNNNFPLKDTINREFDFLYDVFLRETEKLIVGRATLSVKNKRTAWAYVTNKDHYLGGIHNHVETSSINGVFYLNMPETTDFREGTISFYDNEYNETNCFKPSNGDLLIFPNFLNHEPNPISTDEYRIGINMEITLV